MKLKKLVAAVCAAAMAVSAVAVTPLFSSAATKPLHEVTIEESGSVTENGTYTIPVDNTVDYSAVRKITANISTTDYVNGCIGAKDAVITDDPSTADKDESWITQKNEKTGTWTLETPNGIVAGSAQIQFWWLNKGSAAIDSIQLTNADGKNLQEVLGEEIVEPVTPPAQTALATIVAGDKSTEAYEASNDNFNGFNVAELSDVTSVVWNVTCTNANNGYANGQVIFQSDDNDWFQKSFGNGNDWQDNPYDIQVQAGAGTYDITLSTAGLNLNDQTKFTLVIRAYGGATYEINRITLMSGSEVLAYIGKAPTPDTDIDDGGDDDDVLDNDDKPSVSSSSNAAPVIPTDYSVATSNMVKEIRTLAAGSNYEINLTKSNSVVKKLVIKQIAGKDITITITYAGHTWTVNGKDVDTAKPLNFRKALDPDSGYKLPSYVKEVK